MKKRYRISLLILVVSALIIIFFKLQLPTHTILWREIHNAGHAPLFGVLALTILALSILVFGESLTPRYKHYVLAFLATVSIGGVTEFIQIFGSGDADIFDLLRDAIGATSFLGMTAVFDRSEGYGGRNWPGKLRLSIAIISILLFLCPFAPVVAWSMAYIERDAAMPQLADFDTVWSRKFLKTWDCDFLAVAGREPAVQAGGRIGKFELHKAEYPGFKITEPFPDWSVFNRLIIDFECESFAPVKLAIRIEDRDYNRNYSDRFNYSQLISGGPALIALPLDIVRSGPASREMNMKEIDAIYIFAVKPDSAMVLYINKIYLD